VNKPNKYHKQEKCEDMAASHEMMK